MTLARILTAVVIGAFSLYFVATAATALHANWSGGEGDWSADAIVIVCAILFAAACLVAVTRLPPEINSVRTMEFFMVTVMGIFSVYLMKKSAELPVWWIKGSGPGGGAWPFWLAAAMLATCFMVLARWHTRTSPQSQSEDAFMDTPTMIDVGQVTVVLIITVALFHVIGVYLALPLFLIYYVRFFGGHTWRTTAHMTYNITVLTFWFFELALTITLPKGVTDEAFQLFYPKLYALGWYATLSVFALTMLFSPIIETIHFLRRKTFDPPKLS